MSYFFKEQVSKVAGVRLRESGSGWAWKVIQRAKKEGGGGVHQTDYIAEM